MTRHLRALGYDVAYAESRDVHSSTSRRDVRHPHLTRVMRKVWCGDYGRTEDTAWRNRRG